MGRHGGVLGRPRALAIIPPIAGDYTVRVVPFTSARPELQRVGATRKNTPGEPGPGTATARLRQLRGARSLADANNAGEPSIGNSFKTGATMYQACLSTYKVPRQRSPAKATWSDVSANAANGCPPGSTQPGPDPVHRPRNRAHLRVPADRHQLVTCYTDDDGQTWSPSTGGGIPSGVDHQTIGGGTYAAGLGGSPSRLRQRRLLLQPGHRHRLLRRRLDGGTTLSRAVPTYNLTQCGGLHGHLKVAPDGTAYLPNKLRRHGRSGRL